MIERRGPAIANVASAWRDAFASVDVRACLATNGVVNGYLERALGDDPGDRVTGIRGLEGAAMDADLQAFEALRYLLETKVMSGLEEELIEGAIIAVEGTNVIPVTSEDLWDDRRVAGALAACADSIDLVRLTAAMTALESPNLAPQAHGLEHLERIARKGSSIAQGRLLDVASDPNKSEDIRWMAARAVLSLRGEKLDPDIPMPSQQRAAIRRYEANVRQGRKDMLPVILRYAMMGHRPQFAAAVDEAKRVIHENGWDQ